MAISVKKNYLNYNGYRYYKARAQSLELADYGRKKTPVNRANYLDQKGSLENLVKKVKITTFKLTQSNAHKANVIGNFNMAMFGLSGNDFYQQAMAGKWEFVEIHLRDEAGFLRKLNNRTARLNTLKQFNDYRIVDSIIIVMKGKEVRKMRMGHTGAFNGGWNGMSLKINSKTSTRKSNSFEISPDTVYAYGLKKLKWNHTKKKKRTRIVDLSDDPHGL